VFERVSKGILFSSLNTPHTSISQAVDPHSTEESQHTQQHRCAKTQKKNKTMDCVTMVLIERGTRIPLDLVILINSFLPEILTDEIFSEVIALWFQDEEECTRRFGHISDWNTSRITNMRCSFQYKWGFNEDISRWDVRNVTRMSYMFAGATAFNGDLSQWDVGNTTDMSYMFFGATAFNGDLSQWNVGNVRSMRGMFSEASHFNGDLSRWDVTNVADKRSMFEGATDFVGDVTAWNIGD
jgi:surface protein